MHSKNGKISSAITNRIKLLISKKFLWPFWGCSVRKISKYFDFFAFEVSPKFFRMLVQCEALTELNARNANADKE